MKKNRRSSTMALLVGEGAGEHASFHAYYPIAAVQRAIVKGLKSRGLKRSMARDKRCVFQWVPRSRASWKRVEQETLVSGCFFINRGLAHKHRLFNLLNREGEVPFLLRSVSTTWKGLEEAARGMFARESCALVAKASRTNNALGIIFFDSIESLRKQMVENAELSAEDDDPWVLQAYAENMVLAPDGRKCHIRANFLVIGGQPEVLMHDEPVVHVASEKFEHGAWTNREHAHHKSWRNPE